MDTNYFACTLGQAATFQDKPKPYRTIDEFLSHQSNHCGDTPATGFPIPCREGTWRYRVLTFRDVDVGTQVLAARLSNSFALDGQSTKTVALLCHSSPELLFTWLGLIRLGHSVLLIAPQCQPAAIHHLCKECNVELLLHDTAHSERANEAVRIHEEKSDTRLSRSPIPLAAEENILHVIQTQPNFIARISKTNDTDVAYLHHTSGTSSGLPKSIAQTHRAAIGILPHLPTTPTKATFTTTPLYHGGIADVFRSWTSDSLIWLFPGKDLPITAKNICRCLNAATSYSASGHRPKVEYFSSVPYVLQMMEADGSGLEALKSMDIVGVGGAALPTEVGNRLVDRGVNLISRFGSAECGFLLSSYRNFAADQEWHYLRNYSSSKFIDFEDQDDGLAELVVKPGWPHMAKQNRDDGSFATADLFAKNLEIENAWLYHSRADSQLTLITGKKFDPAPLEATIATSKHLDDAVIFGNNQPYCGMLLLRSKEYQNTPDHELIETIWPLVHKLNKESQDHARISQHMLIPVSYQPEPLVKSSKGTIVRRAAEMRFSKLIDSAYDTSHATNGKDIKDGDVSRHLISAIQEMVPNSMPLEEDIDLFSYGVDSIACMRLRNHLRQLIPNHNQAFPLSIIEDSGTVRGLSDYILRKRHGAPNFEGEDEEQLMLDLVKEYSLFGNQKLIPGCGTNGRAVNGKLGEVVVLTGATGALGAHILDLLRRSSTVSTIYCLVRGADENAANQRVSKALEQRGLEGILPGNTPSDKIKVFQAQLGESRFGLPNAVYDYLAAEADLVLHVAWTVNFRLKLRSFAKDNLAGVRNLINFALAAGRPQPPRFAYCSSTAAIMNMEADQMGYLVETISQDPSSASQLGYSRSKWVAEHVCADAHARTPLRGRIAVIRIGQLSGDSETGIWNMKEAWPMMLSTSSLIGCLPDLGDEPVDWLPVDIAAKAFLDAARAQTGEAQDLPVYHVLNPHQQPTWHQMLQWLRKKDGFDIVPPQEWIRRLEGNSDVEHSAMKLLGLWKEAYCKAPQESVIRPRFSIERTQERVPTLRDIQPLSETYLGKIWGWVQKNVQ
ncbi:acetyl-CoA synthetase-like protein [Massarina eburnea CBS 473.64]|uniref:Acetyl-CoA synthetase-like protein n=1 Tax=Massarina eburnea CBS 473.64 TaxID=1395130 RepID=A0A6A6SD54_9PLEO|nr:acetyl-CoA synthetase-like protein [Massarina eburnea CBS 473.64]